MTNRLTTTSEKIGLSPGSLVHVGPAHETAGHISAIDYSLDSIVEIDVQSVSDILPFREKASVTWVNVEGLSNIPFIEEVGNQFNIHPLVLEDILNTHQRPKVEEHEHYLYLALKLISTAEQLFAVHYEQISILVLDTFVFTFREKSDGLFQPLRQRLYNEKGRLRANGVDYLAYVILDTIVDQYFALQDSLDTVIESVEEELLDNPTPSTLGLIQQIKRELIFIRKSVSPLRELLAELLRSDTPLIQDKVQLYLRDVLDHAIRVLESVDSYRDLVSGLQEVYLSSVSNKLNEIMKVLTVFASIFIPLTFIAGIYGMNFEYMPELKWKWAYPALWCAFVIIPLMLLGYFRRKKWL